MAIASAVHRGSWIYVYDEKGRKLAALAVPVTLRVKASLASANPLTAALWRWLDSPLLAAEQLSEKFSPLVMVFPQVVPLLE